MENLRHSSLHINVITGVENVRNGYEAVTEILTFKK